MSQDVQISSVNVNILIRSGSYTKMHKYLLYLLTYSRWEGKISTRLQKGWCDIEVVIQYNQQGYTE